MSTTSTCCAPDFDVAGFYNAENAMAAFMRITDPVRSGYLAEGYDYDGDGAGFSSATRSA